MGQLAFCCGCANGDQLLWLVKLTAAKRSRRPAAASLESAAIIICPLRLLLLLQTLARIDKVATGASLAAGGRLLSMMQVLLLLLVLVVPFSVVAVLAVTLVVLLIELLPLLVLVAMAVTMVVVVVVVLVAVAVVVVVLVVVSALELARRHKTSLAVLAPGRRAT